MADMALIRELDDIKKRLDSIEQHRDVRIKVLEDAHDQLARRIKQLEKRKK